MDNKGIKAYISQTATLNPDDFAMDILTGVMRESANFVGKDGDLMKEFMARTGAMLSQFIETAQHCHKTSQTDEIVGFLGAMRFRYCGQDEKTGGFIC